MGSSTPTSSLTPYQPTWAVRAGPACPTQYRPTVPLPAPSRAACGGQMGVLSRLTGTLASLGFGASGRRRVPLTPAPAWLRPEGVKLMIPEARSRTVVVIKPSNRYIRCIVKITSILVFPKTQRIAETRPRFRSGTFYLS